MLPNINPNDLLIFYTVAVEKSLSSAAEKLFLTQPAVTYHIQSLEGYTRVKLLEFKKRQATLTSHGKELFKYAEAIYEQLMQADKYIKFVREANFRIGIASAYVTLVKPVLLSMFEGQKSGVKLVVKSGNAFEMVEYVLDSTLDLAIVPEFDYGSDKLSHIRVSQPENIICFTSVQQQMPEGPLDWKELVKYPLVMGPETSVIRRILFKKLKEEGLEGISPAVEVSNITWTKTMVEKGKGLGFTVEKDVAKEVAEGKFKLVPLKEYLQVTAEAVTHSEASNPIIGRFIAMVKKAFSYKEVIPLQS
jgi:DNA-binding transcriptional LysR family regulator